jgi:hypothetical protein
MRAELADIASAQAGTRNDTLNRAALRLPQLAAAGHGDVDELHAPLLDAALAAGLAEAEALAAIARGLRSRKGEGEQVDPGPHQQVARAAAGASLRAPLRDPLPGVTVLMDGTPTPGSTMIAGIGAYVLVIATALPDQAVTLTSCYLGRPHSSIAVSHLQADAAGEHLEQLVLAPDSLHATAAGATCSITPQRCGTSSSTAPASPSPSTSPCRRLSAPPTPGGHRPYLASPFQCR